MGEEEYVRQGSGWKGGQRVRDGNFGMEWIRWEGSKQTRREVRGGRSGEAEAPPGLAATEGKLNKSNQTGNRRVDLFRRSPLQGHRGEGGTSRNRNLNKGVWGSRSCNKGKREANHPTKHQKRCAHFEDRNDDVVVELEGSPRDSETKRAKGGPRSGGEDKENKLGRGELASEYMYRI